MSYKLVVNPEAQSDLAGAIAYYDGKRDGLGREFAERVDDVFATIQSSPHLFSEFYRSARMTLVRRFPYVVIYRIVDEEVRITAVFHNRRDSKTWKARLGKSH
jgi:plasmid stabilization system protein ParE